MRFIGVKLWWVISGHSTYIMEAELDMHDYESEAVISEHPLACNVCGGMAGAECECIEDADLGWFECCQDWSCTCDC
jgi:hypothetical protein